MPAPGLLAASTPLHRQPFVVVDLETTGGSALYDRVIEVAAVRVQDGAVQDRFETLVDPLIAVPPFISRLTGITSGMVRGRPTMDAVLPGLRRFAADAVLVAHNASFDYGFLVSASKRAGDPWEADRLCTLRLSRRLLPGLHSYKLDSLCAHLGFSFVQGHRAGPDADATAALLGHLLDMAARDDLLDVAALLRFQSQATSARKRKGQVDDGVVTSLPNGPGVYLLKDDRGHIVYIGKSVRIRDRVRQHLRPSGTAAGPGQPRLRKRLPYIADVEAIETGSELEALILESRLVKRYLPDANRMLRDYRDYPFVKLDLSDPHPRLVATRERPTEGGSYFGPFKSAGRVSSAVQFISEQLGLRQCHGPLQPGQSACHLLDVKKCLGPCVGAASDEQYRAAAGEAERLLRGEDLGVVDRAERRRDALAESLRFEEAAELRDHIREVQYLLSVQERLQSVAERNLAIVAPGGAPGLARVFLLRAGRLVDESTVRTAASTLTLRAHLRRGFGQQASGPITRDQVDDMLILDAWLRTHRGVTAEVSIDPSAPEAAAGAMRDALRSLSAP